MLIMSMPHLNPVVPGHAVLLSTAALWDWPRAVLLWFGDGASTTRGHLAAIGSGLMTKDSQEKCDT